jgi:aryl-alcohol dehydrogenase-like predicted oxidoreductase
MIYRRLGKTGIEVSEISLGVYSVTGMYGDVAPEKAMKILRLARDLGINLFDTADVYGRGYGEEILRKTFGDDVREMVIATKVGYDIYAQDKGLQRRYDPGYIMYAAKKSCERIGKRPIDILQIHNPPLETLRSPQLYRLLRDLVDRGLAEHVGIALGPEKHVLSEALEAIEHGEVEAIQFIYNALEQRPGREIAMRASEKGLGILVRVPHAGGILSERIDRKGFEKLGDHRSLRDRDWLEWAFNLYDSMKPYLKGYSATPGQNSIRFILSSIPVSSVVVIATSEDELREYAEASDKGPLDPVAVRRIIELYEEAETRWAGKWLS